MKTVIEIGRDVVQPYCGVWLDEDVADADLVCYGQPRVEWCADTFDYDGDGDVDLRDFAVLQVEMP